MLDSVKRWMFSSLHASRVYRRKNKLEFYARRVSRNDNAKINAFLRFVQVRTQSIAPNCKEHINYKLFFFFLEENNKFRSFKAVDAKWEQKKIRMWSQLKHVSFNVALFGSMCLHRFAFMCLILAFWNLYLWVYLRVRKKQFQNLWKAFKT